MAVPGNLKQVMDTEGYEKIKANCPAVLLEFAMERMPRRHRVTIHHE
jgi:hypothetical protein